MTTGLETYLEQIIYGDVIPGREAEKEPIITEVIKKEPKPKIKKIVKSKKEPTLEKDTFPRWCFKLDTIDNYKDIIEFDHVYRFKRVKNDTGENTKKFTVHYKLYGTSDWKLLRGFLSNRYLATNMGEYIDSLKQSVEFEKEHLIAEPFKIAWFGTLKDKINVLDLDEAKQLANYMNPEIIVKGVTSNIARLLVNHYNGSASFKDDIAIENVINTNKESISFYNLFTKTAVSSNIAEIRGKHVSNEFVKTITDNYISRISSKRVLAYWSKLDNNYKNLYHLMNVSSIVLCNQWHFGKHNCLRALFSKELMKTP